MKTEIQISRHTALVLLKLLQDQMLAKKFDMSDELKERAEAIESELRTAIEGE